MLQPENRSGPIKSLFYYMKDAIRFHDVGVPFFVQALFVAMIAVLFGGYVLALPYAADLNRISVGVITKLQEIAAADQKTMDVSGVVTPEIMAIAAPDVAKAGSTWLQRAIVAVANNDNLR